MYRVCFQRRFLQVLFVNPVWWRSEVVEDIWQVSLAPQGLFCSEVGFAIASIFWKL